jgi:hypothetical protein
MRIPLRAAAATLGLEGLGTRDRRRSPAALDRAPSSPIKPCGIGARAGTGTGHEASLPSPGRCGALPFHVLVTDAPRAAVATYERLGVAVVTPEAPAAAA